MATSIHDRIQRIQILIEETNDAFLSCGPVNADYAEFATLALPEFKNILRNPLLTRHQLVTLLRTGSNQHNIYKNSETDVGWAAFMAQYITKVARKNHNRSVPKTSWAALYNTQNNEAAGENIT